MTWGVESHIVERFGRAGVAADRISMVKDAFTFTSPDRSPADFIDSLRRFYGPTMNAYEAAEKRSTESCEVWARVTLISPRRWSG